jgi:uncharacterized protein YaeQ
VALKATIFKTSLTVSDTDRHHYQTYRLTLARHPSETDERMMLRLLAFALHADEALAFGKGLSSDEEPDLWLRDAGGAITLWIEVGQPDPRRLRQAAGRATRVVVYSSGGPRSQRWRDEVAGTLARTANVELKTVPPETTTALAALAQRSMTLTCTIQQGEIWMADDQHTVQLSLS